MTPLKELEAKMTPWLDNPPDNSNVKIDILPASFDPQQSNCTMCGGTLQTGWECMRCRADHWPAVERLLNNVALIAQTEEE